MTCEFKGILDVITIEVLVGLVRTQGSKSILALG